MISSLTVQELIEELKRMDPHKPVLMKRAGPIDNVEQSFVDQHSVVMLSQRTSVIFERCDLSESS